MLIRFLLYYNAVVTTLYAAASSNEPSETRTLLTPNPITTLTEIRPHLQKFQNYPFLIITFFINPCLPKEIKSMSYVKVIKRSSKNPHAVKYDWDFTLLQLVQATCDSPMLNLQKLIPGKNI